MRQSAPGGGVRSEPVLHREPAGSAQRWLACAARVRTSGLPGPTRQGSTQSPLMTTTSVGPHSAEVRRLGGSRHPHRGGVAARQALPSSVPAQRMLRTSFHGVRASRRRISSVDAVIACSTHPARHGTPPARPVAGNVGRCRGRRDHQRLGQPLRTQPRPASMRPAHFAWPSPRLPVFDPGAHGGRIGCDFTFGRQPEA